MTVIALVYISFFMNSHEKRNFSGEKGAYGPDTAIIRNHPKTLENFYAPPDSIVLEATGVDTAWLRIVIDGHQSDQLLFTPRVERK